MKLRLIIQSGSLSGHQFELEQGALLLGRGPDCTLRFDAGIDPGVSTRHAIVQAEPDGFYLIDQRSTNGTLVNGASVQRVLLRPGDMIQLGNQGPQIRVVIEGVLAGQQYAQQYAQPYYPQQPWGQPLGSTPLAQQAQQALSEMPTASWKEEAGGAGLRQTMTNFGLYNPEKEKEKGRNYLGIGVALAIGGVMALIVMALMVLQLGFGGALVGTIMAFTPAPFYLLLFLWLDRYDPEPAWALAAAFAWGALFAVLASLVVNTIFGTVAAALIDEQAGNTLSAIISAPIIEEGSKGLGVVLFLIFLRQEFDDILDGIVYAGVIALGFATVENVLYYGGQFLKAGVGGLLLLGFLRGVLSPFAHSLFTSMTGIGCGIARETHNKVLRIAMPITGYFFAVILHGLWNTIASVFGGIGFILAYFVIWMPLFLVFAGVMFYMARREARVIKQMLAIEVARGLVTPEQLELIGSSLGRVKWIASSFGDWKRLNARRHYLRAVTKLAFCYWHVARATAANNQTRSLPQIPKFQAEVLALKEQI